MFQQTTAQSGSLLETAALFFQGHCLRSKAGAGRHCASCSRRYGGTDPGPSSPLHGATGADTLLQPRPHANLSRRDRRLASSAKAVALYPASNHQPHDPDTGASCEHVLALNFLQVRSHHHPYGDLPKHVTNLARCRAANENMAIPLKPSGGAGLVAHRTTSLVGGYP